MYRCLLQNKELLLLLLLAIVALILDFKMVYTVWIVRIWDLSQWTSGIENSKFSLDWSVFIRVCVKDNHRFLRLTTDLRWFTAFFQGMLTKVVHEGFAALTFCQNQWSPGHIVVSVVSNYCSTHRAKTWILMGKLPNVFFFFLFYSLLCRCSPLNICRFHILVQYPVTTSTITILNRNLQSVTNMHVQLKSFMIVCTDKQAVRAVCCFDM